MIDLKCGLYWVAIALWIILGLTWVIAAQCINLGLLHLAIILYCYFDNFVPWPYAFLSVHVIGQVYVGNVLTLVSA